MHYYYFYWRSKGVNVPSLFKKRGFSNVRIRVNEDLVSNKTALLELDEVVRNCLKAGIIPIISYSVDQLRNNPTDPEAIQGFIEWWVVIAKYFRNTSYLLSYDLIIETSDSVGDQRTLLNQG